MKSISIFCGSSADVDTIYINKAREIGALVAKQNIHLIYGGGKVGLMGELADAALKNGGTVTGVIPQFLVDKEVAHDNLSDLIIVNNMHERKLKMHELSEGIIALPGGFGTMEEFFEMLTWAQLGLHGKPLGVLNIKGFFDQLFAFINHINAERFIKTKNRDMILYADKPLELLRIMQAYEAPDIDKWMDENGA